MSEPDLTEAESFLRFISTEGGGAVLHQVRAYLTGGGVIHHFSTGVLFICISLSFPICFL